MDKIYNFRWIVEDIYNSIILKLNYKDNEKKTYYGAYEVDNVLSPVGDELKIRFANIDDLTNLLHMGIIRFVKIENSEDIIDIPIKNISILFENSNDIESSNKKEITIDELDAFAVYDGKVVNKDFSISSYMIDEPSKYLEDFINIAKDFGNMGMQEKFDAIGNINLINYQRVNDDSKKRY